MLNFYQVSSNTHQCHGKVYSDDFINFNSWKKSYIDVDFKKDYSNSDDQTRKLIRENLMNQLSGTVIRIIDNNYSSFMSDQEIRNSVQMCFKNHVSYKILKNVEDGTPCVT